MSQDHLPVRIRKGLPKLTRVDGSAPFSPSDVRLKVNQSGDEHLIKMFAILSDREIMRLRQLFLAGEAGRD